MTQRTGLKGLFLFLLLISPLLPVTVQAEVSSLEVTPASPSQGDVVTIRIAAQQEEEVEVIESAVELGLTSPYSTLLLNVEKDEGTEIVEVNVIGTRLILKGNGLPS